jgi:hypothetical protein
MSGVASGTDLDYLLKTQRTVPERDARAILIQVRDSLHHRQRWSVSLRGALRRWTLFITVNGGRFLVGGTQAEGRLRLWCGQILCGLKYLNTPSGEGPNRRQGIIHYDLKVGPVGDWWIAWMARPREGGQS